MGELLIIYMQAGILVTAGLIAVEVASGLYTGELAKVCREHGTFVVALGVLVMIWIGALLWPVFAWRALQGPGLWRGTNG